MSHPSLISLLRILYVKSATLSLNATNSENGNLIYRQHFTALFKNTRTLRFKTAFTIAFFAAVNHNYVHKQGTMKIKKTHKMDRDPSITIHKPWPLESVEEKLCLLKGPLK